jgi:hypothetical protein
MVTALLMTDRFRLNAPSAVSETIDGEAVIMNLKTGNYYSIDKCGAVLWDWIMQGRSLANVIDLAQHHYSGDAGTIKDAVIQFVGELLNQELVKRVDAGKAIEPSQNASADTRGSRGPFELPQLNVYHDMQDLLLLDPIHDVDDEGWPSAKPDARVDG